MQSVSSADELKLINNTVRGTSMVFVGYTRALELCARMNYEVEVLDFIDSIEAGSVLYDLGACEGRFALYAALRGVKVLAFEPEDRNFEALTRNIEHNNLSPTSFAALKLAVGAADGTSELKIGQPWAGGHQKVVATATGRVDLDFNFTEHQKIEVVSLDSWIEKTGSPLPHYLKVDVDGSEISFLEGAKKTLASPQLKSIMFELSERDPGFEVAIATLAGHGFVRHQSYQIINEPQLFNILFVRQV